MTFELFRSGGVGLEAANYPGRTLHQSSGQINAAGSPGQQHKGAAGAPDETIRGRQDLGAGVTLGRRRFPP